MNLIFFGSSGFAVACLRRIFHSEHNILCVVTRPDTRAARGLSLITTPVKQLSREFKLALYQPKQVNSAQSLEFLRSLRPDLLCVVAFGQIFSEAVLQVPRIMAINLHASLLPKYRGAAPINRALIAGETQTGVSIIRMSGKMDAGPIILQQGLAIADTEDAQALSERLSTQGADLLLEAMGLIQANQYRLMIQDEKEATLAPKLEKADGLICWSRPAEDIFNLIRGCAVWPGAFTYYKDKILKIHRSSLEIEHFKSGGSPGEILRVSKKGILLATGEDNLLVEQLQIEGKKRISVDAFISGHRISVGEILGQGK